MKKIAPKKPSQNPPRSLGKAGRHFWKVIQSEYRIDDPAGLLHLLTACRTEDDLLRMREKVAQDGDVVTDRFNQMQPHPLLGAISRAEGVKRQALRALNLDVEPLRDAAGRPPGGE